MPTLWLTPGHRPLGADLFPRWQLSARLSRRGLAVEAPFSSAWWSGRITSNLGPVGRLNNGPLAEYPLTHTTNQRWPMRRRTPPSFELPRLHLVARNASSRQNRGRKVESALSVPVCIIAYHSRAPCACISTPEARRVDDGPESVNPSHSSLHPLPQLRALARVAVRHDDAKIAVLASNMSAHCGVHTLCSPRSTWSSGTARVSPSPRGRQAGRINICRSNIRRINICLDNHSLERSPS